MEMIVQASLIEWKERLEQEVLVLEECLKGVDTGSNEDFQFSQKLGEKRSMIESIEKELKKSKRKERLKISG